MDGLDANGQRPMASEPKGHVDTGFLAPEVNRAEKGDSTLGQDGGKSKSCRDDVVLRLVGAVVVDASVDASGEVESPRLTSATKAFHQFAGNASVGPVGTLESVRPSPREPITTHAPSVVGGLGPRVRHALLDCHAGPDSQLFKLLSPHGGFATELAVRFAQTLLLDGVIDATRQHRRAKWPFTRPGGICTSGVFRPGAVRVLCGAFPPGARSPGCA